MVDFKKFIPASFREDDDEGDFEDDVTEGESHERVNNILPLLDIPESLEVPDWAMSKEAAKNVQFHHSRPIGYLPAAVDEWHRDVVSTLDWAFKKLHEQQRGIIRLANEFDKAQTDVINQKYTNEYLIGRGRAVLDEHGQVASTDSLEAKVVTLEGDNSTLQGQVESLSAEVASLRALSATADSVGTVADSQASESLSEDEREAFNEWANNVTKEYESLQKEHESLRAELSQAAQKLKEMTDYADQLDAYITQVVGAKGSDAPASVEPTQQETPEVPDEDWSETNDGGEDLSASLSEILSDPGDPTSQVQAADQFTAGYPEPVDESSYYEEGYDETEATPAPAATTPILEGEDDTPESFTSMFQEVKRDSTSDAPELGDNLVREPLAQRNASRIEPGAPLRSIPEGANMEDYI